MVIFDDENAIIPKDDYFELLKENNELHHFKKRSVQLFNALRVCAFLGGMLAMKFFTKWVPLNTPWGIIKFYLSLLFGAAAFSMPLFFISYCCAAVFGDSSSKVVNHIIHIIVVLVAPLVVFFILKGGNVA